MAALTTYNNSQWHNLKHTKYVNKKTSISITNTFFKLRWISWWSTAGGQPEIKKDGEREIGSSYIQSINQSIRLLFKVA